MGKQKGLILSSDCLSQISELIFRQSIFIKKYYDNYVEFFEKVLKQELSEYDKKMIELYFSGFKEMNQDLN